MRLLPGQVIRFTYKHKVFDKHTGAEHKNVLILHPAYGTPAKLHGIDLDRLTDAQREVLNAILDPEALSKWNPAHPHPDALVNHVLGQGKTQGHMVPYDLIHQPLVFYNKFIKRFLVNTDAYRQYYLDPQHMQNMVIVKNVNIAGRNNNPKPVFGDQKPTVGQQQAKDRFEKLQQNAIKGPPPPPGPRPTPPGAASKGVLSAAERMAAMMNKKKPQ